MRIFYGKSEILYFNYFYFYFYLRGGGGGAIFNNKLLDNIDIFFEIIQKLLY